jgi:hypothetical protein
VGWMKGERKTRRDKERDGVRKKSKEKKLGE